MKDGYIHISLSDGRKNVNGKWYATFEGNVYAISGDTAGEAVENLLKEPKESFKNYWKTKQDKCQ